MSEIFPEPIRDLPLADIPLEGCVARLSQGAGHQILFVEYAQGAAAPEHSHESQWGIILEGRIEFTVEGVTTSYGRGDRYFIPKGARHSSNVQAGTVEVIFFNEADRFRSR